jgi:hypothetical protein
MRSRVSCARKWMCWCSAISTLPTGTHRPGKNLYQISERLTLGGGFQITGDGDFDGPYRFGSMRFGISSHAILGGLRHHYVRI